MLGRTAVLSACAFVSTGALAEGHGLGVRAGLLGLGVEYTYDVSERLGVRIGVNGSKLGFDAEESGIAYDFDLVWDSASVAVDFHPGRGAFRLSIGALANDNELEAVSRLTGNVTVGDTTYTPAEVGMLRGRVGFDGTAPFAGLGWDWSRGKDRFGISFDLGVVSQGTPDVTLTADGGLAGGPAFEADLAAEQVQLQESLDDFDLMPYATIGFVFRF